MSSSPKYVVVPFYPDMVPAGQTSHWMLCRDAIFKEHVRLQEEIRSNSEAIQKYQVLTACLQSEKTKCEANNARLQSELTASETRNRRLRELLRSEKAKAGKTLSLKYKLHRQMLESFKLKTQLGNIYRENESMLAKNQAIKTASDEAIKSVRAFFSTELQTLNQKLESLTSKSKQDCNNKDATIAKLEKQLTALSKELADCKIIEEAVKQVNDARFAEQEGRVRSMSENQEFIRQTFLEMQQKHQQQTAIYVKLADHFREKASEYETSDPHQAYARVVEELSQLQIECEHKSNLIMIQEAAAMGDTHIKKFATDLTARYKEALKEKKTIRAEMDHLHSICYDELKRMTEQNVLKMERLYDIFKHIQFNTADSLRRLTRFTIDHELHNAELGVLINNVAANCAEHSDKLQQLMFQVSEELDAPIKFQA